MIKEIKPIINTTQYVFAIQLKNANDAYHKLNAIFNPNLISQLDSSIATIDKIASINSTYAWDDFSKNAAEFNGILQELFPELIENENSVYALPEDLAKKIQKHPLDLNGLKCKLRKYQELGTKYIIHQEKVLLGDEMGLGKTVQAIASMVALRNTGATHFMVVCPASVLINWCREIVAHSDLNAIKLHGSKKKKSYYKWLENGGVAVTTYESLSEFMLSSQFKFSMLIVDEAHYIKNSEAKRTQKVENLCNYAEKLLFMTGTALENRVNEMLDIISMLRPDIAKKAYDIAFMHTAKQFREIISPVYYRRKRSDVLNELPDKIEIKEWCEMTKKEEALYEDAVLNKQIMEARRVSWNLDDLAESSKAKRLKEIIEQAEDDGRKVLVFSFFRETVKNVSQLFNRRCIGTITGETSSEKRQSIIDSFEKAKSGTILVSQIEAGGVGLNIQTASVVVICEPQLKPSIENQAISRVYRMGQARSVSVHRLLCADSIDERITTILEEKQLIFDAFADQSEAALKLNDVEEKTIATLVLAEEFKRITEKRANLVIDDDSDNIPLEENDTKINVDNKEQTQTTSNNIPLQNEKSSEYDKLIDLTYSELVTYLLNKYGEVK
ncbi:MAG: DEAD/DEAH box helicase, partial [Clostridia bacterium]|nr:DEAD/DEAH box helicase [Clostridia bacterium]